mmetsp:Transcript_30079/g.57979  ORF Transcript_30079/g.57979 Transcript_30079/m.57979 type:complete len:663 (-) Transcript_30079:282-2270(-)
MCRRSLLLLLATFCVGARTGGKNENSTTGRDHLSPEGWDALAEFTETKQRLPLDGFFFAVMSYPINVRGRNAIRSTWANDLAALGAQVKFFIGGEDLVEQFSAWEDDEAAAADVVKLKGLRDSKSNLTYKTEATARWIHDHVKDFRYVVKIDEDVLPVPEHILSIAATLPADRLFGGQLIRKGRPSSWGKYKLDREYRYALDADGAYPDYVNGNMYFLSADVVAVLADYHLQTTTSVSSASKSELFPFENIHVAMVLRDKAGIEPVDLLSAVDNQNSVRFMLSHDMFMNQRHDVVPSLCAKAEYAAYHPVSPWLLLHAYGKGLHAATCNYFDLDHSRFWRERNQTFEYYELQNWYDPERVIFSPPSERQELQQRQPAPEETTAAFLVLADLTEITRINILKWKGMSLHSNLSAKILYDEERVDRRNLENLAGGNVELIAMSRQEQTQLYPEVTYNTFSGLYGAPAKPAEITWLATNEAARKYEHAWFVESDVFFTGKFETLFRKYLREPADFVSPHFAANAPGYPDTFWHFWQDCDLASGAVHAHSLISMHRISRSFAIDVHTYLQSGRGGHHEYVLPQLCIMKPECTIHQMNPGEDTFYYRYRPAQNLDWVKNNWVDDRIYHPIKSQAAIDATAKDMAEHTASAERRAAKWRDLLGKASHD